MSSIGAWKQWKKEGEITNNSHLEFGSSNSTSVPLTHAPLISNHTLSPSLNSQPFFLLQNNLSLPLSFSLYSFQAITEALGAPNNTVSFALSLFLFSFLNSYIGASIRYIILLFESMTCHRFYGNSLQFFSSFAT